MLVAIGDNCIDRYLPPIAMERVGGNAVNVAANLAAHGYPAAYAGVVGDDGAGDQVLRALNAIGVNTDCVSRAPGPTGLTEIQVQGGDYAILLEDYGVSDQVDITGPLREFLSRHASRLHLTVTGHAVRLIRELRTVPLPMSVDLGIVRRCADLERFEHLLPFMSQAFFSAGSALTDSVVDALLEKVVSFGAHTAIATRGEHGCTASQNGTRWTLASQIAPGEIVDPLGAGDAFIAGFLSSLNGHSTKDAITTEQCLLTASTWAAEACRQLGGWPGAEQ